MRLADLERLARRSELAEKKKADEEAAARKLERQKRDAEKKLQEEAANKVGHTATTPQLSPRPSSSQSSAASPGTPLPTDAPRPQAFKAKQEAARANKGKKDNKKPAAKKPAAPAAPKPTDAPVEAVTEAVADLEVQ